MRDAGRPPRRDWYVITAVTGRPFFFLNAFFRAFTPARVGFTVNVTLPGLDTVSLPLAKSTRAGRHLPFSLIKPALHFFPRAAKTPYFPFSNVVTQLNVPGSTTNSTNVIAYVAKLKLAPMTLKLLSGITAGLTCTTGGGGLGSCPGPTGSAGVLNAASAPLLGPPALAAEMRRW